MMKIFEVERFSSRLLVLCIVLTVPFVRMLLDHQYGLLYAEVAVALAAVFAFAALLAAVARGRLAFQALMIVVLGLLSINAVQLDFAPSVQLRLLAPALLIGLIGAMMLLKQHFWPILMIFVGGGFVADLGESAVRWWDAVPAAHASAGNHKHVVHVILDEAIGLAGMPDGCEECVTAGTKLRQVFERGAFQIYPYAFSNYQATRDSIPSILNGRLLRRSGELVSFNLDRRPYLHQNLYFDQYLKKNYAIRVYQSDYLLYSSREYPSVKQRTYGAHALSGLHDVPLPFWERPRQLLILFLQSDRVWWNLWSNAFPRSLHPERLRLGPLPLRHLWPDQVIKDFRAASQDTLFFMHLLTPHYSYVYRPDGTLRDPSDWNTHDERVFTDDRPEGYHQRLRLYGGQVQFVATQIDRLIQAIKSTGQYDSTTIIIHGDHGHRLRLLKASEQDQWRKLRAVPGNADSPDFNRYDYIGTPDERDVQNRFSALLAIKPAGAQSHRVIGTPISILHVLQDSFHINPEAKTNPDVDVAYLFEADGSPRRVGAVFDPATVPPAQQSNDGGL